MRGFGKRRDRVERDLRRHRPAPPPALSASIESRITGTARPAARSLARVSFALALATFMFGTFMSFGGWTYASAGAKDTVTAIEQMLDRQPLVRERSSAADQYEEEETGGAAPAVTPPSRGEAAPSFVQEVETLPFTGWSLAATFATALGFLLLGLALLRVARPARN